MMNSDTAQNQIKVTAAGKTPTIADTRVVVLYDGESGMVITTNTVVTYQGAQATSDDAIVKSTLANLEAFYRELAGDAAREKKLAAKGRKLCPIAQIKAVVTKDLSHLAGEFHVDPRSRAITAGPAKIARPK